MSNCSANSASVFSPLIAVRATFALNAAVWFLRGRLLIPSPLHSHLKAAGEQNFHLSTCPNLRYRLFTQVEGADAVMQSLIFASTSEKGFTWKVAYLPDAPVPVTVSYLAEGAILAAKGYPIHSRSLRMGGKPQTFNGG
jgi:hypothetical protein